MADKILDLIELGKESSVIIGSGTRVYFIAHRTGTKKRSTTIDGTEVERVVCQILLDSGVTDKHICVDTISITFDDDADMTYTSKSGIPVNFYLKPIEVVTYAGQKLRSGEVNVSLYSNIQ